MDAKLLLQEANSIADSVIAWRRRVHQNPELGFAEYETAALAASVMNELGARVRTGVGGTGVVAELGQGKPVVALRADMDALPIEEQTGLPYASCRAGLMHACGHDAHVAMLLGTATLLQRHNLPGTVRFLFQPSEESAGTDGLSGAARMIRDGAMQGVDAVYGLHVFVDMPCGSIGVCSGPIQAAADALHITVKGKGCHAAEPHHGRDSIVLAAEIIMHIQTIVSRMVNPLSPAVISIGTIHGGTRGNILPEIVALTGTIRSLDEETRQKLHHELQNLPALAEALGGFCSVEIAHGYPVTINDSAAANLVSTLSVEMLSADNLPVIKPIMGAEDFSLLAQQAQGCFFRLGAAPTEGVSLAHSPKMILNEDALTIGTAMLAGCALRALQA